MRKKLFIGGVVALLVLTAAFALLRLRGGSDDSEERDLVVPGRPPPGEVMDAVALLEDVEGQSAALAADLDEFLADEGEDTGLLPTGSSVQLDDAGWRSEIEGYGNAEGRVIEPDGGEIPVEIGFVQEGGSWLVTYISERHESTGSEEQ